MCCAGGNRAPHGGWSRPGTSERKRDGVSDPGPLEVREGDRLVALGGGKQRALLAILLLHRNEAVSVDVLVDELWGESPPASARRTLQADVSRLRKALSAGGAPAARIGDASGGSTNGVLCTCGHGYLLRVGPGELDLERFCDLVERGRDALARGPVKRLGCCVSRWGCGGVGRWSTSRTSGLRKRRSPSRGGSGSARSRTAWRRSWRSAVIVS